MNRRRKTARRVEDNDVNEGLPPLGNQVAKGVQVHQGIQGSQDDWVTIVEGGNEEQVVPPVMANGEI